MVQVGLGFLISIGVALPSGTEAMTNTGLTTSRSRLSFLVLFLASISALNCGDSSSDSDSIRWEATIDTIGDTIIVRTVSGDEWGGPMELVPEIEIGVLDGADEYMFGDVEALAVGLDGTIYILDGHGPVLRAYDTEGAWLSNIGRDGGGPGEYADPDGGLLVLRNGNLALRDPGNARITLYSPDGAYLESWPFPTALGTSIQLRTDPVSRILTLAATEHEDAAGERVFGLARFEAHGARVDTLLPPTWGFQRQIISVERNVDDRRPGMSTRVPYSPSVRWTYSPLGYFVAGLSSDYRIELRRNGASVLRIEKDWAPVPVNDEEAQVLERQLTLMFGRFSPGWTWNGPPIPDTKPPFQEIFVGVEGRIWVQLHTASVAALSEEEARAEEETAGFPTNRFEESIAFDVFEPDGRYLGRVEVPEGFQVSPEPVFDGESVWAVTEDDLGVQRVARFRLTPASVTAG
jgi:hypothetical protein